MRVLLIILSPARLQKSQHTFVHYYDIHYLINEVENLSEHYNNLKLSLINNTSVTKQISNYDKIILYSKSLILSKLSNLQIHSKNKRGLMNGMGPILKSLTGNLNASDGVKIFKILNQLQITKQRYSNN